MTETTTPTPSTKTPARQWLSLALTFAAGILLGAGGVLLLGGSGEELAPEQTAAELEEEQRREFMLSLATRMEDDPMALGAIDAPVVMIEFADYRCKYCMQFAKTTFPQIIQEYVDSGLLRVEWRDFAIFGEQSTRAAIAARAAAQQDLFWEFQQALTDLAPEGGIAELSDDVLLALAAHIGVPNLERFADDFSSAELAQAVTADVEYGRMLGISGTPTFVVGGTAFSGAQPIDIFRQVIERELALVAE